MSREIVLLFATIAGCTIAGLLIIFLPIYFILGSKGLKRIFAPCKECHFIPNTTSWQTEDGSWHQIQECERCARKRDAVLSRSNLDAAQKFFYSRES